MNSYYFKWEIIIHLQKSYSSFSLEGIIIFKIDISSNIQTIHMHITFIKKNLKKSLKTTSQKFKEHKKNIIFLGNISL